MSMADEDYNRGPVGGTNWWDSSRTPASESMELGLSSQSEPPLHQWNHPLIMRGDKAGAEMGGGEGGFRSMLQQGKEPEFKPIKPGFSLDQQFLDTSSSSSSVYGNFQALMGTSPSPHQQGEGSYGYHHHPDYDGLGLMSGGAGWSSSTNNVVDHHQVLKPNPIISNPGGGGGGGSFWNTSATPSSFFPLPSPLIQQHQIDIPCFDQKPQHNVMEVRDTSGPVRKTSGSSSEQTTTTSTGGTTNKRSRNEASTTTLPPFKVRKEKMGDRITALQQLVSPFGKTDTASVLSEAIEYIKFLHEQVNVLSTPYLKSGASLQHQQTSDKSKDPEGPMQDLRSRGLCLVPVSSTFPVSHETTVDFWTPTFGGTFR